MYLRPSVPFDLWRESGVHTGRCSHHRVDKPNERAIGDVIVALSATLGIAFAKSGSKCNRMCMYISASVLRHRRSLFSFSLQSSLSIRNRSWIRIPQEATCLTTPEQVLLSSLAPMSPEGHDTRKACDTQGGNGARRRVNVTPTVTSAVERAVRPVTSAWRAYGTLLGLIILAAFAFRFQGDSSISVRGERHQCC